MGLPVLVRGVVAVAAAVAVELVGLAALTAMMCAE